MRLSREFLLGTTLGFLLAAGVWLVWLWLGHRPVDITVYPIMQARDGQPHTVGIATYRIDVARQTVMYWRPGMVESPANLQNCAIRDVENWRCEQQIGDFDKSIVSMEMGRYSEDEGNGAIKWEGVTRERWERLQRLEQRR